MVPSTVFIIEVGTSQRYQPLDAMDVAKTKFCLSSKIVMCECFLENATALVLRCENKQFQVNPFSTTKPETYKAIHDF